MADGCKKRSYAETARMFKLRRNLDQLDCFHRQKEHDVLKARSEPGTDRPLELQKLLTYILWTFLDSIQTSTSRKAFFNENLKKKYTGFCPVFSKMFPCFIPFFSAPALFTQGQSYLFQLIRQFVENDFSRGQNISYNVLSPHFPSVFLFVWTMSHWAPDELWCSSMENVCHLPLAQSISGQRGVILQPQ